MVCLNDRTNSQLWKKTIFFQKLHLSYKFINKLMFFVFGRKFFQKNILIFQIDS